MPPEVTALLAAQLGVISRLQALGAGLTPAEIRTLLDRGRWVTLRRGVYAQREAVTTATAEQRHRMHAVAAALLHGGAVVSHGSAALLHRMPWIGTPPSAVHLSGDRWGRSRSGLVVHHARCASPDRTELAGVPATGLARTVCDVASVEPFAVAVAVADAALRAGAMPTVAPLARNAARVRRVLAFADPLAESPGESWGRVRIAEAGLPAPVLQWQIVAAGSSGGGIRADFGWPEEAVAGEFDGRAKYSNVDDLWAERSREQRMRDMGIDVIRWTWADLSNFGPVAERLRRALARRTRRAG